MYDLGGGELLNNIRSMHTNSLVCLRLKGGWKVGVNFLELSGVWYRCVNSH